MAHVELQRKNSLMRHLSGMLFHKYLVYTGPQACIRIAASGINVSRMVIVAMKFLKIYVITNNQNAMRLVL